MMTVAAIEKVPGGTTGQPPAAPPGRGMACTRDDVLPCALGAIL